MILAGVGGIQPTYIALIAAIKDIAFLSNNTNPSGSRKFSITIDQANYLPSNGHYYKFIPNIGITWKDAKLAAQASTYYGLQGYLATITATDESQLAGKQSAGAGWIGGSDETTEGQWQWMTGPETGQNFVFNNWNTSEPNDLNGEDYAHITAVGVGIAGSWNDMSNTGSPSGAYQPKGFVVEYGGTAGDPILQISAFSTITMPQITTFMGAQNCGPARLTLQATANTGQVRWWDDALGGNLVSSSNIFQTPILTTTTTYYAVPFQPGCTNVNRIAITAKIINSPTVIVDGSYPKCKSVSKTISAMASEGTVSWYDSLLATTPIFIGNNFSIPNIIQNQIFYVQADNNGCLSDKVPVQIIFFESPKAEDLTIKLCPNQKIFLTAQNPNVTYLWNTGQTTESIETNGFETNYSVFITNLNNCSATKNFNISYQIIPLIENIIIDGTTATIITKNVGDFEYSLDGVLFQDSNVFTFTIGGDFTIFVRDKKVCGLDKMSFSVVNFQDFFTPNNDSYNDFWQVRGMAQNPQFEASIFDRFDRLIVVLNSKKTEWDGTFNGNNLPSDDYWYSCTLANGQVLKGHFALKR